MSKRGPFDFDESDFNDPNEFLHGLADHTGDARLKALANAGAIAWITDRRPAAKGTISALDIHRTLHEQASPRTWSLHEALQANGETVIHIKDADGNLIGTMIGPKAMDNANLVIHMRNVALEHVASFEHILFRVRYLEQRVRELEQKTGET